MIPNTAAKTYDDVDPTLSFTVSGIHAEDVAEGWSGTAGVSRTAGENAGSYTLTGNAGTLASSIGYHAGNAGGHR